MIDVDKIEKDAMCLDKDKEELHAILHGKIPLAMKIKAEYEPPIDKDFHYE